MGECRYGDFLTDYLQTSKQQQAMIDKQDHFRELLDRLQDGDVTAAEELVDRYGPHICRAIRRRFRSRKMRILYSTEDCLQSVFAQMDRIAKLESPEHLMRYLTRVACNKLVLNPA